MLLGGKLVLDEILDGLRLGGGSELTVTEFLEVGIAGQIYGGRQGDVYL